MEAALQYKEATQRPRISTPGTGNHHPNGSEAGHALTLNMDQSDWAAHHHLFGPQLLQLCILSFERLQTLCIGDLQSAVLPFPVVESRIADPVISAQLGRAHTRRMLLQNANKPRFAGTVSLHRLCPQVENRLTSNRGRFRGGGHSERFH